MEKIMKLKDKVCIVTGAASGLGYGIAKLYVNEGAKVVIADLKADAASAAAAELTKLGPGEAIGIEMDVTNEDAVNNGVAAVAAKWGRVDVLVSNAGIQIVHKIEEFPFADWKKMLAIHLDGAFLTTKACFPLMKSQGGGAIIYMGSVHSKEASELKSAYVTAKHGLLGLARTVAKEGGHYGIRSNVICPGFVRTPLVEKQIPEQAKTLGISEEEVVKKVMLGQTVDGEFTTIEDVAATALFFAGFESNALTGQSIIVSHGWHIE
jgi:3-hydroxybutyrate dehydrogenase